MQVEFRKKKTEDGWIVPRALLLIAESKDESHFLDGLFGSKVNQDATVGSPLTAICKLADGYGEHYISIESK